MLLYIFAVATPIGSQRGAPNDTSMCNVLYMAALAAVSAYQLHLVTQKYSWTHINQVAGTLRLF